MPATCHSRAWRAHRAEVRAFLARRLAAPGDADDLLQEVFVKAVRQGKAFCALENPRAWLFHVARNLLIDRRRRVSADVPLPDDLSDDLSDGLPGEPLEVPAAAPLDALVDCLPRVLSELSDEDRAAIVACEIEGLTQQAYALRLGISLAAAKSRVQRARRRLQAQLVSACQVEFDADGKVCCFVPRPALPDVEPVEDSR